MWGLNLLLPEFICNYVNTFCVFAVKQINVDKLNVDCSFECRTYNMYKFS